MKQDLPDLNFKNALFQAQKILNVWKPRSLTPLGRITIIKTLILPKFNHLFASLPTPDKIINELNKILFDYLWEGKPDKIKRSIVCQNYDHGGLKMVDLFKFEKSMKLNWIKRITKQKMMLGSNSCLQK